MKNDRLKLLYEDEVLRLFFKPALLHSAPVKNGGRSACDIYSSEYGFNSDFDDLENGLLYRLDYKTSGLLVFAHSKSILDSLRSSDVVKTYDAFSMSVDKRAEGFFNLPILENARDELDKHGSFIFSSYFRSYGKNGAFSRPVMRSDIAHFKNKNLTKSEYVTKIKKEIEVGSVNQAYKFECVIHKGARHQIRSTLASLRYPIDGDLDYGSTVVSADGSISLVCSALSFSCSGHVYNFVLRDLLDLKEA